MDKKFEHVIGNIKLLKVPFGTSWTGVILVDDEKKILIDSAALPEDVDNEVEDKPSRFGFVNSFREHQEKRNREYAEYKLNKMTENATKKKKGGKK